MTGADGPVARPPSRNGSFRVFLSYADQDRSKAELIRNQLESAGLTVQSGEDAALGDSFTSSILRQLHEADAVVVLVSKASASSSWLNTEVSAALSEDIRRTLPLLPVILEKDVEMPFFLRTRAALDLSSGERVDIGQLVTRAIKARQTTEAVDYRSFEERVLELEREGLRAERANYERRLVLTEWYLLGSSALLVLAGLGGAVALLVFHYDLSVVAAAISAVVSVIAAVGGWAAGKRAKGAG